MVGTWFGLVLVTTLTNCFCASQAPTQLTQLDKASFRTRPEFELVQQCKLDELLARQQRRSNGTKPLSSSENLPEIKSSISSNEDKFVESAQMIHRNNEQELAGQPLGELVLKNTIAVAQSTAYSDIYFHRYDSFEDMKRAAGPDVNNELCLGQLNDMVRRVERQERAGFASRDLNILRIRETWASGPRKMLEGNLFAEGDYEECLRLKLNSSEGKQVGLRYCVLSAKLDSWRQLDRHDILQIKAGVCIPSSCDSLDYKNKYDLISELASFQLRFGGRNQTKVTTLYCLPDERSEFRSIWRSPKSLAVLICVIGWVSLQLYATFRCHNEGKHSPRIYQKLSIINNFKLLSSTGRNLPSRSGPSDEESEQSPGRSLDLNCIDGIKVLAMCYIIAGHMFICMPTLTANYNALSRRGLRSLVYTLTNLMPAWTVNSFFAITGLLTCYTTLKRHSKPESGPIASPRGCLAALGRRYLRIMPTYALVVLYCKTLAKFTGSGPLWDYGTSALSQRRACEHESWRWTLTFSANFDHKPLEQCILTVWYLANDFQFLAITPPLLMVLQKRPRFGEFLLQAGVAASCMAGALSLYGDKATDFRAIANFSPTAFKTYTSQLVFNYTRPQYRISAYLIGLLAGHKLFQLEQARRRNEPEAHTGAAKEVAGWSRGFAQFGAYLLTYLLLSQAITPPIAALIPFERAGARLMTALISPTYHVLAALATCWFIMLAATGHINRQLARFLSAPIWGPLAKLSLCVMLVNFEVLNYIVQTRTTRTRATNVSQLELHVWGIVASYSVAGVVCLLFELPTRALIVGVVK